MYNLKKEEHLLRISDLLENPSPRVPVCLCLDTSGSMRTVESGGYRDTGRRQVIDGATYRLVEGGKTRLEELEKGLHSFFEAVRRDEDAADAAEISLVTFDDGARTICDFASIERQILPEHLETGNNTDLGQGLKLSLDLLEKRKSEYQDKGVDYFQPWLIIMTDGKPNGDPAVLEEAVQRIRTMVEARKLTVFPIGIGREAGMDILARLSPKRPPLYLKDMKFDDFFEWLSQSVTVVSRSMPGEDIKLDVSQIEGWGSLYL